MIASPEIWLFGSAARGDADDLSDVDVLVAGSLDPELLSHLPYPPERVSLVRYDWPELSQMAGYGSLFLHHVHLEGTPIYSPPRSELAALLENLPPYERAQYELESFGRVLDDVEESLRDDHSPPFELAVIATALRHACILGCYAIQRPTFGRQSAFDVFLRYAGYGDLVEPAQQLYDFRLFEDNRARAPFRATTTDVEIWLDRARKVVGAVNKELNGIC